MVAVLLTIMAAAMFAAMIAGSRARKIHDQNKQIYKQANRHKYPRK